jgi:hypothetical protein
MECWKFYRLAPVNFPAGMRRCTPKTAYIYSSRLYVFFISIGHLRLLYIDLNHYPERIFSAVLLQLCRGLPTHYG